MATKEVPFSELLSAVVDNRGRSCPTVPAGIPLIATNCIRNELLFPTYENARFVSQHTYSTWFRGHPIPGDILFVNKATPGRVCLVPDPVDFCIAQDMVAVRAEPGKVYPKYLFAALRSQLVQDRIGAMHVGTLIPHFKKGDFDKLMIPVPDRKAQESIGDTYYELSAKIDLNRRMNETLEAIAQVLFKSWFVDFDPVRAKAEGRDPSLPPRFADLFPDSFWDSELGEIPKPWRAVPLGDASVFPLVSPGVQLPEGTQVKYIATGDVQGGVISGEVTGFLGELPSRANMQPGDGRIWFARMKDSPKHLWTMDEDQSWWARRILSTGFAGIQARPRQLEPLLYGFISSPVFDEMKNGLATGTTMQALNNKTLGTVQVVVPDPPVIELFDRLVRPIYRRVWGNVFESGTLATLRDSLLRELLAGRVRATGGIGGLDVASP
jgi:type I restriction enzyme S subunit